MNWDDLVYMQDMTPEACASGTTSTNTTGDTYQKQLIDSRDGKKYWVAKLKDGNCWMTQNLDLDLTNITLTPSDSDVTINWMPNLMPELWSDQTNNTIKFYDPGEKYCPNGNCSSTSVTSSNNGHDAQGNYYSWNAAVAGTGGTITTTGINATGSICPKGWQLPTSNSTTANKSFGYLLNGLNDTTLLAAPYYYIHGGYVNNGAMTYAYGTYGVSGFYWSSTVFGRANSYSLVLSPGGIYPSNSSGAVPDRHNGYALRCVAR